MFGVHAGKWILCAGACPRCSFFKSGFLPKCYGRGKRYRASFFSIFLEVPYFNSLSLFACPRLVFCGGFLMVSAGCLALLTSRLGRLLVDCLRHRLCHRLCSCQNGWGRIILVAPGLWTSDSFAICVSPAIFERIGCALEFRSCRYVGCPGADDVAWVRLGRRFLLLFACPR